MTCKYFPFIIGVIIAAALAWLLVIAFVPSPETKEAAVKSPTSMKLSNGENLARPVPSKPEVPHSKTAQVPVAPEERNAWTVFQRAIASNKREEIYAGVKAARECSGMENGDLSTLISNLSASIPREDPNRETRLAAASKLQHLCSGFALQTTVSDDMQKLWDKLKILNADEYKANELGSAMTRQSSIASQGELRSQICATLVASRENFDLLEEMGQGLAVYIARNNNGDFRRNISINGAIVPLLRCKRRASCSRNLAMELAACAVTGECSPESEVPFHRSTMNEREWELVNTRVDMVNSIIDTGKCTMLVGGRIGSLEVTAVVP